MKITARIVFISSFLLYIFAPKDYSLFQCVLYFILFIVNVYLCTAEDIKDKFYFSFTILFSISFFLTVFAYPVFIKNIDSIYLFGMQNVDDQYINKSTALAQLAFSLFTLFYVQKIYHSKNKNTTNEYKIITNYNFRSIYNFLFVIILLYFFYEYYLLISNSNSVINFEAGIATTLLITISSLITITYTFNNRKKPETIYHFIKKNLLFYLCITLIFLSLLYIGDRGIIIVLFLLILSTYDNYINRIKLKYIIPFLVFAILFLFIIGNTRNTERSIKDKGIISIFEHERQLHYWDYFSDLTSISRNLYNGYEYAETHELLYPEKIIIIAVSPIPYLPTLLSNLFYDKEYGELSSGTVLTNYTADQMNVYLSGGLGTHCVADIYMSWGIIGIFVFFSLLGYSLGVSRQKLNTSVYAAFFYFIFLSYAIYIPRSTIFVGYDIIGKTILIFFILKSLTYKK